MVEPIPPEAYLAIAASAHHAVTKYKDKRVYKKNEKLRKLESHSTSTGWTNDSLSTTSSTRSLEELLDRNGLGLGQDGYVQWSMSSPDHPRNWSSMRKGFDLGLLVWLGFLMAAGSAVGTPASSYALRDFHVSKVVGILGFTTIYLLGQGLGSLLFSPYPEAFGRRRLYIASAFLYSMFCIPVAATPNIAAVFVGRFITGVLSAVPNVAVRGNIEDLLDSEGRTRGFFIWSLVTNIGLVIGPIFACYIAVALNWRWTFYLAAIIVATTSLLMLFMRESRPSQLLDRKVALLQGQRNDLVLRTQTHDTAPDLRTFIQLSLLRPLRLFFTEPIVFLTSVISAFAFGLIYLLAEALPIVYAKYNFSRQKATLLFLFVALGLLLSTFTRFYDRRVTRQRRMKNLPLCPEKKLFGFALGAPLLAVSLWWFAWTVPPHMTGVAWPASAVSLILLGYATNEFDTVLSRYLTDSYTSYAASTFSSLTLLRAIFSAVFPLFTTPLYTNLNNNVATSVLAAIATVFCIAPVVFIIYGRRLRGASRFARESMPREEIEALERVRSEKVERRREEREGMREREEEAVARGVDLGACAVVPYF